MKIPDENGHSKNLNSRSKSKAKIVYKQHTALPAHFFRWPKKDCFWFSVVGLSGIHRNLKHKIHFSCINPWFGGPWDMLLIFFLIAIFIMLQKNAFGKKNFKFHARVQKCHFSNFSIFPKWHFWPVHEIWNSFWPKAFFWSLLKMAIRKISVTCPRFHQIKDLCRKMYKKGIF